MVIQSTHVGLFPVLEIRLKYKCYASRSYCNMEHTFKRYLLEIIMIEKDIQKGRSID